MSKLILLASLSLAACATGGGVLGAAHDAAPSAKVRLSIHAAPDTTRTLPSVDRFAYQVRARLGDDAVATVKLCVSAAGRVTKVALVKGTTFEPFDQALLRDVGAWQFAARPGPASLEVCDLAKIAYRAPR